MSTYFDLADFRSTSTEAYLDGRRLVRVLTFDLTTGYVDVEYGEGKERICNTVSPLRVEAIEEGSVAEMIVERGMARYKKHAEHIWNFNR